MADPVIQQHLDENDPGSMEFVFYYLRAAS
jgi:hypothetical protein